jgi:hypothetical protein
MQRKLARAIIGFLIVFGEGVAVGKTPARPAVLGNWHGKYVCVQGVTALNLRIIESPSGGIAATFRFGPLPENPSVPKGSYLMEGSFEAKSRRLVLKGVRWLDDSSGYLMVDLDGLLATNGQRISGKVPFAGCSNFMLERDAQGVR